MLKVQSAGGTAGSDGCFLTFALVRIGKNGRAWVLAVGTEAEIDQQVRQANDLHAGAGCRFVKRRSSLVWHLLDEAAAIEAAAVGGPQLFAAVRPGPSGKARAACVGTESEVDAFLRITRILPGPTETPLVKRRVVWQLQGGEAGLCLTHNQNKRATPAA